MKVRIKLDEFPERTKGQCYYGLMEDEAQYERVKNHNILYERSKRVTHYLVPASVFDRLLNLDRASEKMCGNLEMYEDEETGELKMRCSCCKVYIENHNVNFCPECGADLREPEEYDAEDPNKPEDKNDE